MSDVASLDLSRELYELSGWGEDTSFVWWVNKPKKNTDNVLGRDYYCVYRLEPKGHYRPQEFPAYGLGYLLRKLPDTIGLYDFTMWKLKNTYAVAYVDEKNNVGAIGTHQAYKKADTPEDCVAKLCIELIKQGAIQL